MKHIASTLAVAASVALAGRDQPGVRFADVAGINEAVQELEEVAEFLKHPDKFSALGARIPRGVLLVGPPGSGKTLLARAVAGEAGIPFFSTAGSAFVEMFAGVGASRVRDLFAQAKSKAPCIVFVDEIDAVGRQRGTGRGGVNGEREQTLNQLLVEMDGFDSSTNVIVIGATYRPDVLDSALLQLSAYHEAGHAVVGRFVPNHDPLHGISITSRGMLGGRTRFLPPEDRNYLNRSQLNAMLASALGGQAAELMVFGEISTSARDDIQKATHIARRMVTQYGMSERLGPVGARNDYSDKIAEAIDDEIRGLVDEAKAQAISIVTGHRKVLDCLALQLVPKESLDNTDLERIFRRELESRPELMHLPSHSQHRAA